LCRTGLKDGGVDSEANLSLLVRSGTEAGLRRAVEVALGIRLRERLNHALRIPGRGIARAHVAVRCRGRGIAVLEAVAPGTEEIDGHADRQNGKFR